MASKQCAELLFLFFVCFFAKNNISQRWNMAIMHYRSRCFLSPQQSGFLKSILHYWRIANTELPFIWSILETIDRDLETHLNVLFAYVQWNFRIKSNKMGYKFIRQRCYFAYRYNRILQPRCCIFKLTGEHRKNGTRPLINFFNTKFIG